MAFFRTVFCIDQTILENYFSSFPKVIQINLVFRICSGGHRIWSEAEWKNHTNLQELKWTWNFKMGNNHNHWCYPTDELGVGTNYQISHNSVGVWGWFTYLAEATSWLCSGASKSSDNNWCRQWTLAERRVAHFDQTRSRGKIEKIRTEEDWKIQTVLLTLIWPSHLSDCNSRILGSEGLDFFAFFFECERLLVVSFSDFSILPSWSRTCDKSWKKMLIQNRIGKRSSQM